MSQAETLLETLAMNVAQHTHPVVDSDSYYTIDPISKTISNGRGSKKVIMQYDHNSERITFALPRFVDGHDMLLCNRVRVHWNNIDSSTGQENAETYEVDDLRINPEDDATVICSWTISRNSTQLVGILSFLVQYECVENGESVYEWHSDIYSDLEVKEGRNNSEQSIIEYTDILEQWRARLFGAGDTVIEEIAAASESQKAAIESKGAETLATIPEDFTATYNMADRAFRTRANAIMATAEGETIITDDCSDDYLRGLHIYGRTTQDGIPTPEDPQELNSVDNPTVYVLGKNLLKTVAATQTLNGVTFTVRDDGSFYVKGTATTAAYFGINYQIVGLVPGRTYIITGCPEGGSPTTYRLYAQTEDGTNFAGDVGLGARFTATAEKWQVLFVVYRNNTVDFEVKPMLRDASIEDSTYEPYISRQEITLDYTLRGIPVESGGNYTDLNGQQWICDEIDLERGVYIQRVGIQTFNNAFEYVNESSVDGSGVFYCGLAGYDTSSYTLGMLSDHFIFAGYNTHNSEAVAQLSAGEFSYIRNPTAGARLYFAVEGVTSKEEATNWLATYQPTVYYQLKTPVETPLTDEELFAFSQLHSNYLVTTMLNTENAYMGLVYNADTKTYFTNSRASDEQVQAAVNAWLTKYFANAEEVSF